MTRPLPPHLRHKANPPPAPSSFDNGVSLGNCVISSTSETVDTTSDAFDSLSMATKKHSKSPHTHTANMMTTQKRASGWRNKEPPPPVELGDDNGGWGFAPEPDYNSPAALLDWRGERLPAPVDWSERAQCVRDDIDRVLDDWLKGTYGTDIESRLDLTKVAGFTDANALSICLADWIPDKIENENLQTFWSMHFLTSPDPLDIEDKPSLTGPFWKHRVNDFFIGAPAPVEGGRLKTADDHNERRLWKLSLCQTASLAIGCITKDEVEDGFNARRFLTRLLTAKSGANGG